MASPFFNGLHAFFQLHDFCIHHSIALQQGLVFSLLIGNLLSQVGHLRQAAVSHPQAVLQTTQEQEQDKKQPVRTAHRISGIQ
ncbi:hypothetical protein D3C84_930270 [compost metagenome]